MINLKISKRKESNFLGSSVVKILSIQCRRHGFHPKQPKKKKRGAIEDYGSGRHEQLGIRQTQGCFVQHGEYSHLVMTVNGK